MCPMLDANSRHHLLDPPSPFGRRIFSQEQRELDVFFHRECWKKVEKLENGGDLLATQCRNGFILHRQEILPLECHQPLVWAIHPAQAMEQGAFS